jgi:hypothetical protein
MSTINRGDLFPPLKRTLQKQNETTGIWETIDLTNATSVTMFMVSGATEIYGACVIVSPRTSGKVEYEWAAGDTEISGSYQQQFEILWSNGKTQTVPNKNYDTFIIQDDLAGDA